MKKTPVILVLCLCIVGNMAYQKRDSSQLSYELVGLQQLANLAEMTVQPVSNSNPASLSLTSNMASVTSVATRFDATPIATSIAITTTFGTSSIATATPTDTTTTLDNGYPDNGEAFSKLPTSSSFGNTIYAGAVTFDAPKSSSSVLPLYPIQSNMNITFKWQYTAIRVRPVNVTLNAVAPNSVTYPISVLDGATSEATWHFSSVPTTSPPLMNGYYKIQLYDQRGVKADYSPGWMVPCTTLSIALYSPDLYNTYSTDANYCPTCFYSSANTLFYETFRSLAMMFGVALGTSFIFLFKVLY